MKKLFLLTITVFGLFTAMAQDSTDRKKKRREEKKQRINAIIKQEEEGVIKYKKHLAFGFKLTSDGYGGFVEVARAQSIRSAWLFQMEITERKQEKEEKQQNIQNVFSASSPIIYGKINYFYPIKLGAQYQYLLGNKRE